MKEKEVGLLFATEVSSVLAFCIEISLFSRFLTILVIPKVIESIAAKLVDAKQTITMSHVGSMVLS